MELQELKKSLPDYQLAFYGNIDLSSNVNRIKFYTHDTVFSNDTIYMGSTKMLPSPSTPGTFAFLCYGPTFDVLKYENSQFHVIYAPTCKSSLELFNKIQDELFHIQKINAGLHMLINAFFTEQGLQYFVDVAYHVFGNPMFIIDNSHKYLAVSAGILTDNVLLSKENQEGYISEQGLSFIRQAKIDEQIRSNNSPVYFTNPLHGKGMLVDAITINNIEVGHVMLYEQDHPFQEFDSIMLHRTSRIISMELQKNSFITMNKGFMYSYFLADLLDNPETNYSSVIERLSILNYDLKEKQYIIVIPSRSYCNTNTRLDVIVEQLHKLLPNSIYVIYENTIVVLISRYQKDGISEYEYDRLLNFLESNHLTAGLSNEFYHLKDARSYYKQAQKAVELGQKLHPQHAIHQYSENYLYHIFEMCEPLENLNHFIHPGLLRLREYDVKHNTDLIETLTEYLHSPGQPGLVSKRLHIHKNTLLYRMEKIREITDCPIENGDDYLKFGLSLEIMKYLA